MASKSFESFRKKFDIFFVVGYDKGVNELILKIFLN